VRGLPTSSACLTTSNPLTEADPDVGSSSVVNSLVIVVLPALFGPSNPNSTFLNLKRDIIHSNDLSGGTFDDANIAPKNAMKV